MQNPSKSNPLKHLHPTVRDYVNSSAIANGYDLYFTGLPLFRYDQQFIRRHLPSPPASVLDLGCGTGRLALPLAGAGYDYCGLDLSPHMLAAAADQCTTLDETLRTRIRFLQADFHDLPVTEIGNVAAICAMFSTLGLIQGREKRQLILRGLKRVLDPGGLLIFHVHNRETARFTQLRPATLTERVARLFYKLEEGDAIMPNYRGLQPLFCHFFSREEIITDLSKTGYQIITLEALNSERNGPARDQHDTSQANGFLVAAKSIKTD